MAKTSKDQYVITAHRLICAEGLEHISVRKIVAELHCTPGALYKHFESLDYLVALASIRILKDYILAIGELGKEPNTIHTNLRAWKYFIQYAFENPAVYYAVFFGPYNARMGNVLRDYCEIFPETLEALASTQLPIVLNHCLAERDVMGMEESIGKEIPDRETAGRIARVDCCIVRSLLLENMKEDAAARQRAADECYHLIEMQVMQNVVR